MVGYGFPALAGKVDLSHFWHESRQSFFRRAHFAVAASDVVGLFDSGTDSIRFALQALDAQRMRRDDIARRASLSQIVLSINTATSF